MSCDKVFVFPLEILSIIKDFLFDYKIPFSKNVLPNIKENYPTKIYSKGPRSSAIDIWRNGGKGVWVILYDVPKYMKMESQRRSLGLRNEWSDKYSMTKEHRYFYNTSENFDDYL